MRLRERRQHAQAAGEDFRSWLRINASEDVSLVSPSARAKPHSNYKPVALCGTNVAKGAFLPRSGGGRFISVGAF